MIGKTLNHYEIIEPLGAGGMGEVYRAHDTTLMRDVAIKVLPEELSADMERLARLEREAQLLAALNHPNIAAVYGLEESRAEDGTSTRFIVLELIQGESLAERLSRGRIEVEKALGLARQIAEALEAAHAKGIIHRDLKPGNVVITPECQVKVLDFGLAKSAGAERAGAGESRDIAESPTVAAATRAGIILGTAAYMSPEQARGKPLDKRTDIWSFGCVLYEMLVGKKAFDGETVTDVLAAIVEREPDWSAVPHDAPPIVQLLLRQCLEKDPYLRLHDMADARIQIIKAANEPEEGLPGVGPLVVRSPLWRRTLPWGAGVAMGAIAAGLAIWSLMRPTPEEPRALIRFQVELPPDVSITAMGSSSAVAISPDGTHLVLSANQQLYVRAMDDPLVVPLRGTEGGATNPFFSPDGRWVGFWAEGELRKVPNSGGAAMRLCSAANPTGAKWGDNDQIVYAQGVRGIWKVSGSGGEPEQLISLEGGERAFGPEVLPGGQWVLYTLRSGLTDADDEIVVQSLVTGERKMLIAEARGARYLPTGHLTYLPFLSEVLMARPFNLSRAELTGGAVPVVRGVAGADSIGAVHFSVSREGTLAYIAGAEYTGLLRLVWVDRNGESRPVTDQLRPYRAPRLSPDGDRVSLGVRGVGGQDIWILEVEQNILTRLTSEGRINLYSTWTADGERVAFASNRGETFDLYWKRADFSDQEAQLILARDIHVFPAAWLPEGQSLVFRENSSTTQRNILVLSLDADGSPGAPLSFLATEFNERAAMLSPDGHWLAYVSDWSGRDEVYVEPFPGPRGRRVQVSNQGGLEPLWGPDGREVFYRDGDRMISVAVETEPSFEIRAREVLFEGAYLGEVDRTSYDIHPDGQRFLMIEEENFEASNQQINFVLNWFEELKRLVPLEQ